MTLCFYDFGEIPATYTTLDSTDKDSTVTLSGGNLTATKNATTGYDANVFAAHGKESGKWRFQVRVDTFTGGQTLYIGLVGAMYISRTANPIGGTVSNYFAANGSNVYLNGVSQGTLSLAAGHYYDFYVDLDAGKVWIYDNDVSFSGDASTGTGGFSLSAIRKAVYPWAKLYNASTAVTFNFGATAFNYTGVAGFAGWSDSTPAASKSVFRTVGIQIRSAGFFAHGWAEAEVMASSGGSNIISGATGTSNLTELSGNVFSRSVDGNTTTHVQIGNGSVSAQENANVWYELGSSATRNATHVAFRAINGGGGVGQQCPTLFDLWYSTGTASGGAFYKGGHGYTFTTFADATPGTRKEQAL